MSWLESTAAVRKPQIETSGTLASSASSKPQGGVFQSVEGCASIASSGAGSGLNVTA